MDIDTLKILIAVVLGFIIAQLTKVVLHYINKKKINTKLFLHTGGMPSSHTATTVALSASLFILEGFSRLFAVAIVFTALIMVDSLLIRRAVGEQGKILNQLIKDLKKVKIKEKFVDEVLGHTPLQVFVGAVLGIVIALIIFSSKI